MAENLKEPNNWESDSHRIKAKDDFIAELLSNEEELNKCRESCDYAKTKFAQIGGFHIAGAPPTEGLLPLDPESNIQPIPADTQFRVYKGGKIDSERLKRDKQVVIVLPAVGVPREDIKEVLEWRCTYSPYADRLGSLE